MTPDALHAWRTHLKLSQRAAAAALGVTLATYQSWERGRSFGADSKTIEIPPMVGLACAALAAGLAPWFADQSGRHTRNT